MARLTQIVKGFPKKMRKTIANNAQLVSAVICGTVFGSCFGTLASFFVSNPAFAAALGIGTGLAMGWATLSEVDVCEKYPCGDEI